MGASLASDFAVALRRHRLAAGLSQQELAELSGLSVRGISALERGERRSPQPATVRQLADALGLDATARAGLIAVARASSRSGLEPGDRHASAIDAAGARRPAAWPPLPVPPTPLIGRERALAEIRDLAGHTEADGPRLLTLTGPGGIGKTRLALAAARELSPAFNGRVAWVELAAIRDQAFVATAIAAAVSGQVDTGQVLVEALIDILIGQPALLVLDNFEHLLDAAPLVSTLLARCRHLSVLSTSRERLHIRGERVLPVAPLAAPAPWAEGRPPTVAEVAGAAAVRLFVDRAADADHGFQLTAENAGDVARICRRLEGMPLALELAAAQMHVLTPTAILARLTPRLSGLVNGHRDLNERQQSMSDTIAWSYDLLDPDQQALFRRLGVFSGGFTPAAAEAVCGAGLLRAIGDSAPRTRGVRDEGIGALVQKSLLERDRRPGPTDRFQMLEVIREFAADRLSASGEAETIRRAHAAHFLADAGAFNRGTMVTMDIVPALARVEADLPNHRAALTWFATAGDAEAMLWLAGSLDWFWAHNQHVREGADWLEQALALPGPAAPAIRARALMAHGVLLYHMGDDRRTETLYTEALAVATAGGDKIGVTLAVSSLGSLAIYQNDYARAAALSEQALALCATLADPHIASWLAASTLSNLGWATHRLGSSGVAREHLDRAVAQFREMGYMLGLMRTLQYAAGVARDRGDFDAAAHAFHESLELAAKLGDDRLLAAAFDGTATVAIARGRPDRAARLFAVSESLREQLGGRQAVRSLDPQASDRGVAAGRAALGAAAFDRAWAAGRALTKAAAMDEARACLPAPGAAAVEHAGADRDTVA